VFQNMLFKAIKGTNTLTASDQDTFVIDNWTTQELDDMVKRLAGSNPDLLADRQAFSAGIIEPIQQIIPYLELYNRFFMQVQYDWGEDPKIPVEDLVNVSYATDRSGSIFYNKPGYYFTRPTWSTWTSGITMPWNLAAKAGWNVLARQMNYVAWDLARKRDAAALAIINAAVPAAHVVAATTAITKANVDAVIKGSHQIGFPVKFAVVDPSVLMNMMAWTWVMPQTSNEVGKQLVDNLYYGQYGGVNWFTSPNASTSTVYFGGDPTQVGWHQQEGTPRNDSAIDITLGVDNYTFRDANHSWTIGSGLSLWEITIA
jgi:hypothetical protein